MSRSLTGGLALATLSALVLPPQARGDEIVGHAVRPERVEATEARRQDLRVPDGFGVGVFAEGLENPRTMAVRDDGTVYVSQPEPGNLLRLRDADGDGRADEREVVASDLGTRLHGLALHDGRLYIATVHKVYAAEVNEDGSLGEPRELLGDLPDGGQHPKRTLGFGPDGRLYIQVGSTCNACDEPNEEHATLLRAQPDGSGRTVFASGLRNVIGFDWHPETGQLWGADHGSDWRGDDDPPDELNRIEAGRDFGWPYCFGERRPDPTMEASPGVESLEAYCQGTEPMALGFTAHSAPIAFLFYEGDMFPDGYRNDAFAAFRGSWNRKPPTGYKVVRVEFDENGEPTGYEDFLTGFLLDAETDQPKHFGPAGGRRRAAGRVAAGLRRRQRRDLPGEPRGGAPGGAGGAVAPRGGAGRVRRSP